MLPDEQPHLAPTDQSAVTSVSAGVLALIAVCIAIIPVPFTGFICFPAAAILTVVSVWHGIRSLRRYRSLSVGERAMSVAGITASGLAVLLSLCSAAVLAILGFRLAGAIGQFLR